MARVPYNPALFGGAAPPRGRVPFDPTLFGPPADFSNVQSGGRTTTPQKREILSLPATAKLRPDKDFLSRIAILNSEGDAEAMQALVQQRFPGAEVGPGADGTLYVRMPDGNSYPVNRPGVSPADIESFGTAIVAETPAIIASRGRSVARAPGAIKRAGGALARGGAAAGSGSLVTRMLTGLGQSEAGVQRPLIDPGELAFDTTIGGLTEAAMGPLFGLVGKGVRAGVDKLKNRAADKAAAALSSEGARRIAQAAGLTEGPPEVLERAGRYIMAKIEPKTALRKAQAEFAGMSPTVGQVTGDTDILGREADVRGGTLGADPQRQFRERIEANETAARGRTREVARGSSTAEPIGAGTLGERAQAPLFAQREATREAASTAMDEAKSRASGALIPAEAIGPLRKQIDNAVRSRFAGGAIPARVQRALDRIDGKATQALGAADELATPPGQVVGPNGRPLVPAGEAPQAYTSFADIIELRQALNDASRKGAMTPAGVGAGEAVGELDRITAGMRASGVIPDTAPGVREYDAANEAYRRFKAQFAEPDELGRVTKPEYLSDLDNPTANVAIPALAPEKVLDVLGASDAGSRIDRIFAKVPADTPAGKELRDSYRRGMFERIAGGAMEGRGIQSAANAIRNGLKAARKNGSAQVLTKQDQKALESLASAFERQAKAAGHPVNPSGTTPWAISNMLRALESQGALTGAVAGGAAMAGASEGDTTLQRAGWLLPALAILGVRGARNRAGTKATRTLLDATVDNVRRAQRRRPGPRRARPPIAGGIAGALVAGEDD
jgi:hypothetical protein